MTSMTSNDFHGFKYNYCKLYCQFSDIVDYITENPGWGCVCRLLHMPVNPKITVITKKILGICHLASHTVQFARGSLDLFFSHTLLHSTHLSFSWWTMQVTLCQNIILVQKVKDLKNSLVYILSPISAFLSTFFTKSFEKENILAFFDKIQFFCHSV